MMNIHAHCLSFLNMEDLFQLLSKQRNTTSTPSVIPMPICVESIYVFEAVLYDAYASSDWTFRFVHQDIGYFNLIILISLSFCLVCLFLL